MHRTTTRFWKLFEDLPQKVQQTARRNFELLKVDPLHRSLHFKKVGKFWSIRVDLNYRALAIKEGQDFIWVWIGDHSDYERMIKGIG
ncbi:hypothetical protein JCM13304A_22320 [Desulfothermus okinawensis JCM 13304]